MNIPGLLRAAKENDKPSLPLPNAEVVELIELLEECADSLEGVIPVFSAGTGDEDVVYTGQYLLARKLRQAGLGEGSDG